MNKSLKEKHLIFIYSIILLLIFVFWNYCQPLVADDLSRSAVDALQKSPMQIMGLVYYDYMTWTGRVVAQILVYLFLSKNYLYILLPLVNFINSLVLLFILYETDKLICGKHKKFYSFFVISFFYLSYFIAIGTFSQDFLWKTAAIQYAWGYALLLWVILRFYDLIINGYRSGIVELCFYAICGIILGFYNEIYIAILCDIYLAALITALIFKNPVRLLLKREYLVFYICLIIAALISIKAPGNYIRQSTYIAHLANIKHFSWWLKIAMTYVQFFRYGYHIVVAFILVLIAYYTYSRRTLFSHQFKIELSFYLILLNIHIVSFVGIAYYSPVSGRMLLIMDSIIFIIITKFIYALIKVSNSLNLIKNSTKYCLIVIFILLIAYVSTSYLLLYNFNHKRDTIIKKFILSGGGNLQIDSYCVNKILRYTIYFDDIGPFSASANNKGFALFYQLKSVSAIPCD